MGIKRKIEGKAFGDWVFGLLERWEPYEWQVNGREGYLWPLTRDEGERQKYLSDVHLHIFNKKYDVEIGPKYIEEGGVQHPAGLATGVLVSVLDPKTRSDMPGWQKDAVWELNEYVEEMLRAAAAGGEIEPWSRSEDDIEEFISEHFANKRSTGKSAKEERADQRAEEKDRKVEREELKKARARLNKAKSELAQAKTKQDKDKAKAKVKLYSKTVADLESN